MYYRNPNHLLGLYASMTSLLLFLLLVSMTLVEQRVVFADTIKGAIRQRIGNYDMEDENPSTKSSCKYKFQNSIKDWEC